MEERWLAIPDPVHAARGLAALPFELAVQTLNQPELEHRAGFDPARASAPFVATRVDMSALVIHCTVAWVVLRGTLL